MDKENEVGNNGSISVSSMSSASDAILNLPPHQLQELLAKHFEGLGEKGVNVKDYKDQRIGEIKEVTRTKIIYCIQFIGSDDDLNFGGNLQKLVCNGAKLRPGTEYIIWTNGGKEAFRRTLTMKRKSIGQAIQKEMKKSKWISGLI